MKEQQSVRLGATIRTVREREALRAGVVVRSSCYSLLVQGVHASVGHTSQVAPLHGEAEADSATMKALQLPFGVEMPSSTAGSQILQIGFDETIY